MTERGFSLIELSIVLTILAVLIAGGLTLTTAEVGHDKLSGTYEEIDVINDALSIFVNEHHRLPCPARLDVARGDPEFGREATDCADASPPSGMTYTEYPAASTQFVRIGGVPFYSLGLPDEYFADEWSRRYLYAVSSAFIAGVASSDIGHIEVRDETATALTTEAAWVVVSHGKSGRGAYGAKSVAIGVACAGGAMDGENCDGDGLFVDALYDDGGISAASFYDDLIQWETVPGLYNADDTDCTGSDPSLTYIPYNGACYAYLNQTMNWANAQAACQALGADFNLASITSLDEQNFISGNVVSAASGKLWIGLNDQGAEGSFVWVADNSALGGWSNWASPPAGSGDCVVMNEPGHATNPSEWEDGDCALTTYEAVCEK